MPQPDISALKDDIGTLPESDDFLPAAMQALHYYTEMMQYEQLQNPASTSKPSYVAPTTKKPTTTTRKPLTTTTRATTRPTTTTRRTTTTTQRTTTPRTTQRTTQRTTTRRTTARTTQRPQTTKTTTQVYEFGINLPREFRKTFDCKLLIEIRIQIRHDRISLAIRRPKSRPTGFTSAFR